MERYTLGYDPPALAFVSRRTLESHGAFFIPHLRHGMQVLDVGCGPGSMTVGIAARIGAGRVTGVDMSESQVQLAARRAREHGVRNVEFHLGSAYALPFPDAQYDALFSHALLEHLRDPVRAMREFLRVLKQGGVMGVATPDWSGFLVAPPSAELGAALEAFKALQVGNGGDVSIGHKLGQFAVEAGFEAVTLQARYENYQPLSIIADLLTAQLDQAGQAEHVRTLRAWQRTSHAMFAQAWVMCVGYRGPA